MEKLDKLQAESFGGDMETNKRAGTRRFSTFNPNGLKSHNANDTIEISIEMGIDVQCYSEIAMDTRQYRVRQKLIDNLRQIDKKAKAVWNSSTKSSTNEYKAGGTSICTFGNTAGRVKKHGEDKLGRWCWQILEGSKRRDILVVSVYQCCKNPTNKHGSTAYHQQEALLSELNREDTNPRRNFLRDMKDFLHQKIDNHKEDGIQLEPMLMGDWNEECRGSSNAQNICDEFQLVDIWKRKYKDEEFNTYIEGSRRLDFAITTTRIADIVSNITYEPFFYRLTGDHRGLYFDIDEEQLFGDHEPKVYSVQNRGFTSKDRTAVTAYIPNFHKHCSKNNIFASARKLIDDGKRNDALAEQIDNEISRACKHGENKCRKRRPEYWCVELHEARRREAIWCQFQSRQKRKLNSTSLIDRAKSAGIELDPTMDKKELASKVAAVKYEVKMLRKESREKREEHLLDLANLSEDKDDKTTTKILREMAKQERISNTYRMFNYHRGKYKDSQGIDRVTIPSSWIPATAKMNRDEPNNTKRNEKLPQTSQHSKSQTMREDDIMINLEDPKTVDDDDQSLWTEVNDPKEVEFLLRLRNRKHFGQSEHEKTPFTQEPLKTKFNWSATTGVAEKVLHGDYTDEEIVGIQRLFVDNCRRVTELDSLAPKVTIADLRGKFTSWRENTSTSPSGRHLGHYKILFSKVDHRLPEEEQDEIRAQQKDIQQLYVDMINYAIEHKYSYERWKHVVNQMIYKDPGNTKIHRLRVIHLYECDLNFILGCKWREAIHKAQEEGTINEGQYGGCPGREPTALTLLEELRIDYSMLTRESIAQFDNDASSCYDRILVSIASLASRKFGIHKDVVMVHAKTLQEAKFKLKTQKGVSESWYSHCTAFPIHGTGQGSGNSPVIWCFVSSILFDCHNQKAHGIVFSSPNRQVVARMSMVGFVDDSTTITGCDQDNEDQTANKLIERMQHDAQLWSDLLWCSGGKLELPKCSFHILHYNYHNSGEPVLSYKIHDGVNLRDADNNEIPIKAKSVYTTHKTLGHHKAPAGTNRTQHEKILEKAEDLANALTRSSASRTDAMRFYTTIYRPAVKYTLAQSFLTDSQLHEIEKASMPAIYSKCGYNRKTARNALQGPTELGGGGIVPLKAAAGTGYCLHFLKYWRSPHEMVGKKLRIVLAWCQYQAGVTFPILENTSTPLPWMPSRFIPAVRKYLDEIQATIEIDETFIQEKLRTKDRSLMEIALAQDLTEDELKRFNYCRLFVGAMYLSEICKAEGSSLVPGISTGDTSYTEYKTTLQQPKQQKPDKKSWKVWTKVLAYITKGSNTLKNDLGKWTEAHSDAGTWKSYYSTEKNRVMRFENNRWEQYKFRGLQSLQHEHHTNYRIKHNDRPIQATTLRNGMTFARGFDMNQQQEEIVFAPRFSWGELLAQQPKWVTYLILHVELK